MAEKRDILWRFLGDAKGLDRASKAAQKDLGGVQKGMKGVGKAAGLLGGALAGAQVATFAKDAVQMAIAADEAASKFEAVFGTSEDAARAMATFADKAGVATAVSQDLFGMLGNLAQAQGFSADESIQLAEDVSVLAGDIASFNDEDPAEVFRKLGLAITTTERESLKPFGIAVTEAEVKQRALNLALADGRTEVSKADRAQASYNIILEQAGTAVGDLDRTSDSMANTQRRLTARWKDAQTELGRRLLPALEDMVPLLEDAIPLMGAAAGVAGEFAEQLGFIVNPLDNMSDSVEDNRSNLEKWGDAASGWIGWVANGTASVPLLGRAVKNLSERMDRIGGNTREAEQAAEDYNAVIDRSHSHILKLEGSLEDVAEDFDKAGDAGEEAALKVLPRWAEVLGVVGATQSELDAMAPAFERVGRRIVGRYGPETPRYQHTGGTVPGIGDVPTILQGGERVTRKGQPGHDGGGGITINFNGVVGDPDAVAAEISDLLQRYQQTNGSPLTGLSEW